MEDYPDARKFYFEKSYDRRIEFKRRMRKFYLTLESRGVIDKMFVKDDSNMGSSFWKSEIDVAQDGDEEYVSEEYEDEDDDDENQNKQPQPSFDEFDAYSDGLGKGKKEKKRASDTYQYINKRISKFYMIDQREIAA